MSTSPEGPVPPRQDSWQTALYVLAGVFALITCAGLIISVERLSRAEASPPVTDIALLALLLLVGLFGVVVCLGLTVILTRFKRQGETLTHVDQQTAILAEQSIARNSAATTYAASREGAEDHAAVVRAIEELKEIALLPEQERQRRFNLLVEREFQQGLHRVEQHARLRDYHRARLELDGLARRFGQNERLVSARQQLEQAAQAARAQDIAQVTQRVNEMMEQSRWDEATRATRELAQKHPDAPEANALVERVATERKAFAIQHRQRMYEELQALASQRQWSQAADATRLFLRTFPNDPESEILREQLKTLDANIEIQYRQNVEREIKSHIQQKRYWDALALARQLIAAYPLSPQANALRPQVPRLEELAEQHKA